MIAFHCAFSPSCFPSCGAVGRYGDFYLEADCRKGHMYSYEGYPDAPAGYGCVLSLLCILFHGHCRSRHCRGGLPLSLSISLAMYLCICLSIYLSMGKCICLSIDQYIYLSISLNLHIYLFTYLSTHLFISIYLYVCLRLPVYLFIHLSIYRSICICVYLPIYLSLSLSLSLSRCLHLRLFFRPHLLRPAAGLVAGTCQRDGHVALALP